MPHFILEYSANLNDDLDLDGLFGALHETAMDTGVFARFQHVSATKWGTHKYTNMQM